MTKKTSQKAQDSASDSEVETVTVNVTEKAEAEPVNVTEAQPDTGPDMLDQLAAEIDSQDKPAEPEKKPEIPTADLLRDGFHGLFSALAPAWQVTRAECESMGRGWAPVIDKYLPGMLDSIFGAAIASTALVIAPRIGKPRKLPPKPKTQPAKQGGQQPPPPQQPQQPASDGGASVYGY